MKIGDILKQDCVTTNISGITKKDILTMLSRPIAETYGMDLDALVDNLLDREKLASTGMGDGIAIPHARVGRSRKIFASLGISRSGVRYDSIDAKPCHIFFLIVTPDVLESRHLKALARVALVLKNPGLRQNLMSAETADKAYRIIIEYDNKLDE